jgi:hypothetical protein
MEQSSAEKILEVVKDLRSTTSWIEELEAVAYVIEEIEKMDRVVTVRKLAKVLSKSKTWVGDSLVIIEGIKKYPEMLAFHNRNQAYQFAKSKEK